MNDDRSQDIRQRMAALRTELEEDVQGVSDSARAMSDWRFYVRRFPFAAAGLAAAAGFLLVPKRSQVIVPDAETLAAMAKQNRVWVKTGAPQPQDKQRGMLGGLLALAASAGARLAMNWATAQLKSSLAEAGSRKSPEREEEEEEPFPQSSKYPPR